MTARDADHLNPTTWVELPNRRPQIGALEDQILDQVDRLAYPKTSRFAIKLALEEGVTNAFEHGHATVDPELPIRVGYKVAPESVVIVIEDQGPGFNPGAVPDPTAPENLTEPHGRGLMLIRAYMSEVSFNDTGNQIRMVYHRPEHDAD